MMSNFPKVLRTSYKYLQKIISEAVNKISHGEVGKAPVSAPGQSPVSLLVLKLRGSGSPEVVRKAWVKGRSLP